MAKLVHAVTGEEILIGSTHKTHNSDDLWQLVSFEVPRSYNSSGRVVLRSHKVKGSTCEVFPSVIEAKIVDYCANCGMDSDDFESYNDPDGMYNTICGNCEWLSNDPRNRKEK